MSVSAQLNRTLIGVENLHKRYREVHALRGVTFQVESGHIMGLVGPNGAGKTTTMRIASGIIPPSQGTVVIAGHDVTSDPVAAKRELAYVPDDPNLFDTLTVWEHLEFFGAAYRVKEFPSKAEALLEHFELTEKRNTIALELSRG